MEQDFSLVCQRTDDGDGDGDGDDGACFDHFRPSRDAFHHHVLQASCQDDLFGVTHSSHTLLSPIHHIGAGRWFPSDGSCSGYPSQSAKAARELRLRKAVQTTLQTLFGWH